MNTRAGESTNYPILHEQMLSWDGVVVQIIISEGSTVKVNGIMENLEISSERRAKKHAKEQGFAARVDWKDTVFETQGGNKILMNQHQQATKKSIIYRKTNNYTCKVKEDICTEVS